MSSKSDRAITPNWYWKKGLHDARIVSIAYQQLTPDWKAKHNYYNSMEIEIDSAHALFETDIVLIRLFNYKLHTKQIADVNNLWWYKDTLNVFEGEKANLLIVLENSKGDFIQMNVDFESAELIRNI